MGSMRRKHKFTKGEWLRDGLFIYASGEDGANICAVSEPRASTTVGYTPVRLGSPDLEEAFANARLLKAAPKLLQALELFVDSAGKAWDSLQGSDLGIGVLLAGARSAIEEATGDAN